MYRPSAFYWGRTLSELPQHTVFSFLIATIAYWMYGLQSQVSKYVVFVIVVVLEASAGAGLLFLFSAMAYDLEQSNLLATVFVLIFMLFDGNWVSLDKIPVYWRWVRYLSFMGYAGRSAMANEYRGLTFECTDKEIKDDECIYDDGKLDGEDVLKERGVDDTDIAVSVVWIVVLNIAYRVLAFFAVLFMHRSVPVRVVWKNLWN